MINSPYDIAKIKEQAKTSIEEGALTKDYALNIEDACKLLNDALASEIVCVLRYRYHQIIAKSIDKPQVVKEFEEHAMDEERHMMLIAERINQLGGEPDFNPSTITSRAATEYKSGKNLTDLIKENLIAERIAIMMYRELINWFGAQDPTTRRLLEDILKEEEDHANDLADLIEY